MTRRTQVFAIIAVVWCVVIFMLSSQPADESSETSSTFVDIIIDTVFPDFDTKPAERQEEIRDTVTVIVRKGAHFSAYALLGALIFQAMRPVRDKRIRSGAAVGLSCLYSVSDEIHQTFVPGRSGEVRDVLIDTGGALTAVLISLLVIYLLGKRKKPAGKD